MFYKHIGWNALVHVASGLVQHLRWKGQNCKPFFSHMVFISSLHYKILQELNLISSSFRNISYLHGINMFDLPPMSDPIIQNSDFGVQYDHHWYRHGFCHMTDIATDMECVTSGTSENCVKYFWARVKFPRINAKHYSHCEICRIQARVFTLV